MTVSSTIIAIVEHRHVGHAAIAVARIDVGAEERNCSIVGVGGGTLRDEVELLFQLRRIDRSGSNSFTSTRTETQAWQPSQYGT